MKHASKKFSNGASVLVLGTVSGQTLVLAAAPFMSRLYSPEQFGTFSLFVALFAFLNITSSGRFELAIPIAKTDYFSLSVMNLAYLILVLITITLLAISSPLHEAIVHHSDLSIPKSFVYVLIASVFFSGVYRITSFWAFRQLKFGIVALARFAQGLGLVITQIGAGVVGLLNLGLMLGHTIGFVISSLIVLHLAARSMLIFFKYLSIKRIVAVAKRFRKFPIYSIWSDLMNTVGTQLPVFVILYFFSPAAAGLYFLAVRVANAPVAIIAEAVTKTVLATASKRELKPVLPEFSCKIFGGLLRIGTVPMLCMLPLGPTLFSFLFGPEWEPAGHYFSLLIPWTLAVFAVVPMLSLFHVAERQKEEFCAQLLIFLGRSTALIAGALSGSIELALVLFSAIAATTYFIAGTWALHSIGSSIGSIINIVGKELLIGLSAMVFVIASVQLAPQESKLIFGIVMSAPLTAWALLSGTNNFKGESAIVV